MFQRRCPKSKLPGTLLLELPSRLVFLFYFILFYLFICCIGSLLLLMGFL